MQVDSIKISKVFSDGGDIHYILPHFQREYSWDKAQWKTLLDDAFDIYETYEPGNEPEHFLGSLVVIGDGNRGVMSAFKLVDGQQRLTTISLLFCALRDLIKDKKPRLARQCEKMLVNRDEENDLYFKLLPTTKYNDRQNYINLINQAQPLEPESKILEAYNYFKQVIKEKQDTDNFDINKFITVVNNCFQVVLINLNAKESPYKIFESLNAKGKPLSQADLIRNYIAMRLPAPEQEKVFNQYWGKIESLLQEQKTVGGSRIGELTAFLRHYLASHNRSLCAEGHTYARFRDRCEKIFSETEQFIKEIATISDFAEYYSKLLRPEKEIDREISRSLSRLNDLDIATAYPFLLVMYQAYDQEKITRHEMLDVLEIIENYLVRRYLCKEATNYLGKMFPTLWREIEDERLNQLSLQEAVKKVLANKNYPPDRQIQTAIQRNRLYDTATKGNAKLRLVLETINRHLSKGTGGYTILDGNATIEHILPQESTEEWQKQLGENWQIIYQDYLHTLGNLTLVTQEWNRDLSNKSFAVKREQLANHALRINRDYFAQDIRCWDEDAILTRSDFIYEQVREIWPSIGEAEVKDKKSFSKPKSVIICGQTYTITDQTWRQFTIKVVEWAISFRPQAFVTAQQCFPTYLKNSLEAKDSPNNWYRLSNGFFLAMNLSAKGHYSFCQRFLSKVGVSERNWSWEKVEN